jgi:hypothetical protein
MKSRTTTVAAILTAAILVAPAAATATTIDFDSMSHGEVLTTQFAGVTFSLLGSPPTAGPVAYALKDGGIANTGAEIPASELFGAFRLAITPGSVADSIFPPFYDIEIAFADPVDFFAVTVLDAEESFATQGFLGASLIQTAGAVNLLGTRGTGPFAGPVYRPELGSIGGPLLFDRIVLSLSDGPEIFDNLSYNVAVPEPSTAAILGVGLLGLSGLRRVRR